MHLASFWKKSFRNSEMTHWLIRNLKDRLCLSAITSDYFCCGWLTLRVIQINWVSPQLTGQIPVHWKVTCMLVISFRGRKGRFWSHVGSLGKRANIFCPQRSAHQKKNAVIQAVLEHGLLFSGRKPVPRPYLSPLGHCPAPMQTSYFIGLYNLDSLFFSGIGALLCHHPYCFPSQSQTLFGIGLGRPPSGNIVPTNILVTYIWEFPLVTSIPLTF